MKNTLFNKVLFFLFSITFFGFIACGGANGENASTSLQGKADSEHESPYYDDIVLSNSGEFSGIEIGETRTSVKQKLPEDAFDNESESYLYYKWNIGDHVYNLDLFFDGEDKLNSIDGYVRFYDSKGAYDKDQALAFYKDLKADFLTKYGEEQEVNLDDFTYIRWIFDQKDVEIGIDNAEVYWYVYAYKDKEQ